ncbi:uncharacterized protein LOC134684963 [Mytilus trossulus]|uniref:uncharacterized protein LOC134684963 n=1 Tax=Mytilus trossulus TaxID=6551 RepID=UPI0030047742
MELDVATLNITELVAYNTSYAYDMAYHNKYLYFQLRRSDYNAITRWMYIVERSFGILKFRFDLSEIQSIVNFTVAPVYCMDIEAEEKKLYWINYDGDMKAPNNNGSDVKIILSTNVRRSYNGISVSGTYLYLPKNNKLFMVFNT